MNHKENKLEYHPALATHRDSMPPHLAHLAASRTNRTAKAAKCANPTRKMKFPSRFESIILILVILFTYSNSTVNGQTFSSSLLKDIYEVSGAQSFAGLFFEGTDYVLFKATDGFAGDELWITKGTTESTQLLKDINPGSAGSSPSNFYRVGDVVYFSCFHPDYGRELWRTNGTLEGTYLVKDIYPGSSDGFIPSAFQNITSVNGKIYFIAYDNTGQGLWVSDGTPEGTNRMITESIFDKKIWTLNSFKENIFFNAQSNVDNASGLYKYDIIGNETIIIKDANVKLFTSLFSNSNYLFFEGASFSTPQYLYATDGSPESVTPIFTQTNADPRIVISDILYFTVRSDGGLNDELWKTNGTIGETVKVKEGFSFPSLPNRASFAKKGNELIFIASTPGFGRELWRSNGTTEGTNIIKDIFPGSSGNVGPQLVSIDSIVFFCADNGSNGWNVVWMSDGTSDGTVEVKNYFVEPEQRYRVDAEDLNLTVTSIGIFFTPNKYHTSSYGAEPYIIGVPKFLDEDNDGYGAQVTFAFNAPPEYVLNGNDCDDSNPDVYPGAPPKPDGLDNDCDGLIDRVPQTITFNPLPDKNTDDESFNLSASSTSGLPVAFTSSNESVATIQGSLVTIVKTGHTEITASQLGDENYLPAQSVTQSLTINLVTGIESPLSGYLVQAYPNPAFESVSISFPYNLKNLTIEITDMLGRVIFCTKPSEHQPISINISSLSDGIYFIRVTNIDGFIKQIKILKHS